MKRKIVLIVSLVAGLLAAVLTLFYIEAKEAEMRDYKESLYARMGGRADVLCFNKDVPGGAVIAREDLGYRTVPAVGLRGQAVLKTELNDVIGRKLVFGHAESDVLFWADVEGGNPSAGGLSSDVKRQMRALSINCTGAAAVSGMVRPNDHVDVIGTFDMAGPEAASAGQKHFVTCTILQNVLVLATGSRTAKTRARDFGALDGAYTTVTLEVTPREAEMLAFAEQLRGRLILSLRNRNDTSYERELPKVDFEKIRGEIEELNLKRQQQKLVTH